MAATSELLPRIYKPEDRCHQYRTWDWPAELVTLYSIPQNGVMFESEG